MHDGWTSAWMDVAIHQMPKFKVSESRVLQVELPHDDVGKERKLNGNDDVKMALTFDKNKLMIPWVILFESQTRKSLNKMEITFAHNEFAILRVDYELICKY
jgi:hypothetical protein